MTAADLSSQLADAGVTRLVLIRHANAAPPGNKAKTEYGHIHDWQKDDQLRPLTDKGKQQAAAARSWFGQKVTLKANKVLVTSGARRASETLQLLTEEKSSGGLMAKMFGCSSGEAVAAQANMDLMGSLHPAGIAPKCEELFDTLGYGPLTKFYDKDGGKQAFDEYAGMVAKELGALCVKVKSNQGNTISCFGHAVFLNAVAMFVAEQAWGAGSDVIQRLKSMDLGEAQGILLEKTASGVTLAHLKA